MTKLQLFLTAVLAIFLFESAYVIYTMGYVGFFEAAFANPATSLMAFDLVICLTIIAVWMVRDAREQGRSPLVYLLLTATLGSAGPLLYLIRRSSVRAQAPGRGEATAAQTA